MHFKNHSTVLQEARETSFSEFVKNYDLTNLLDAPNDYLVNGSPLIKCLPASKASNHLVEHGRFTNTIEQVVSTQHIVASTTLLMSVLTNDIINVKNAGNYKQCVETMKGIQEAIGTKFYGALFINDKTILNPFHPVTAMLMADEEKYKELHALTYRIVIYAFPDDETYSSMHLEYYSEDANKEHIEANLNALLQVAAHQVTTEIKLIDSKIYTAATELVSLKYQISKHPDEAPDYEFYLSAHQMLTSGIVLPWYGTSFIKLNGSASGYHISPMRSCNINGGELPQNTDSKTHWSSVCTGSIPNSTLKGLRTLNHANLLSPYSRYIVAPGALVYAQMAVNKSFQIYRSAGFIKGTLYEETYLSTNKNSGKASSDTNTL